MRIKALILAVALGGALLTGCDFLRKVAGRPTSADITALRDKIAEEEAARAKAVADSIAAIEKWRADSLAAEEALRTVPGLAFSIKSLGGIYGKRPSSKYLVIVGAFSNPDFAAKRAAACAKDGYPAEVIFFRSGLRAVGILPSDEAFFVTDTLEKLRGGTVCPPKSWILINE
ncbi:MAG: hypothetical protein IK045_04530 [Bacteroidales bacterium]|nr:hypothetical protein [Bacteroidales bacterium]